MPNRRTVMFVLVKLHVLNKLRSTIGSRCHTSTITKRITLPTAAPKSDRMGTEDQPHSFPWMTANTRQKIAIVSVSRPGTSICLLTEGSRVSGTKSNVSTIPTAQIGRLTRKIQRQSKVWTRKPPMIGPNAAPMPPHRSPDADSGTALLAREDDHH